MEILKVLLLVLAAIVASRTLTDHARDVQASERAIRSSGHDSRDHHAFARMARAQGKVRQ